MIHFLATLKSPATLAFGAIGAGIFGEAISQDTPITLQAACITGCVIVTVALWITNRFNQSDKRIDKIDSKVDSLLKDTAYFHKTIHDKFLKDNPELK